MLPVEEDDRGTYLLSAKDLCLINRIPEIVDMGIESLKIEGRLKTEYYLATVVNAYRCAIDDYLADKKAWEPTKYQVELDKAMSRKYSELFYSREDNPDIQNYDDDGRSSVPYEYGAKVLEKNEDLSVVEVRNKLQVGSTYEMIIPGEIEPEIITIEALYDYDTKERIDVANPGKSEQKVLMKLPDNAENNFVIRRRK